MVKEQYTAIDTEESNATCLSYVLPTKTNDLVLICAYFYTHGWQSSFEIQHWPHISWRWIIRRMVDDTIIYNQDTVDDTEIKLRTSIDVIDFITAHNTDGSIGHNGLRTDNGLKLELNNGNICKNIGYICAILSEEGWNGNGKYDNEKAYISLTRRASSMSVADICPKVHTPDTMCVDSMPASDRSIQLTVFFTGLLISVLLFFFIM